MIACAEREGKAKPRRRRAPSRAARVEIYPPRRRDVVLDPAEVRVVSHQAYDPASPGEVGVLTIAGVLHTYVSSVAGWAMMEAGTGRVHNVRGRVSLSGCSCLAYYHCTDRHREGKVNGRCVHMLALTIAQRSYPVCGQAVPVEFTRQGKGAVDVAA